MRGLFPAGDDGRRRNDLFAIRVRLHLDRMQSLVIPEVHRVPLRRGPIGNDEFRMAPIRQGDRHAAITKGNAP